MYKDKEKWNWFNRKLLLTKIKSIHTNCHLKTSTNESLTYHGLCWIYILGWLAGIAVSKKDDCISSLNLGHWFIAQLFGTNILHAQKYSVR